MKKINILDKTITNRISAGEVVEKPASIVKELLENSIDAGATRITVEIVNGGIDKIAVTDNGSGIAEEDMTLTIMPHATSKIQSLEDLDAIGTLGFRGEALASIASVSILEIISKPAEGQELGQKLFAKGGEIVSVSPIAAPNGTHVEVSSLFYNTPVRAKFLRKPKTEEADITDYIERIMLAFPNIAFKYIIDGKIKYNTTGGSLFNNIYTIYGKETAGNLIEVNYQTDKFRIEGYIGRPEIAKSNRNYQTLLVSGRYVKNFMISSAVQTAFDNFLMKHKFPFFVLNLVVPFDNVDVNVHPNKLEVKFENANAIFKAFHTCTLVHLSKVDQTRNINLFEDEKKEVAEENSINPPLPELTDNQGVSFKDKNKEAEEQMAFLANLKTDLNNQVVDESTLFFSKPSISNKITPSEITVKIASDELENKQEIKQNPEIQIYEIKEEIKQQEKQESLVEEVSVYDVVDYKIVGTLFKTYNIIESGEFVYFIDQHAAHERILYDKYIEELKTNTIAQQQLFVPFVLKVKDVESVFLNSYSKRLIQAGFEIEEFGFNTFKVSAVPYIFASLKLDKFFEDLLKDISNFEKTPLDYIKNVIATKACRSAVKAGNNLTDLEIKTIFQTMKQGVLQCPHGRPFVLKLDKLQVEKWFKRVL
ncbi:MAG: DNA mismatch repair endonuclease MutL [Christensenellales bacterium]